jgi:hypothetical protein
MLKKLLSVLLLGITTAFSQTIEVRTAAELNTVLHSSVAPGTTIFLHGGRYVGTFESTLNGTAAAPIVVRSFPGETAVLDNAGAGENVMWAKGSYTIFRNLEFTNTNPNVTRSEAGFNFADSRGNKLINSVLKNSGATGINPYWAATESEIYGNLVYYYGRFDDVEGANGYGIYGQNNLPSKKLIQDNFIFRGFGIFTLHLSGSSAAHIDGFNVIANTFFGHDLYSEKNPIALIGNFETGSGKAADDVFSENMLYRASLWVGYNGDGATRFTHDDNYYYKGVFAPSNTDYLSNARNVFTTNGDRVFVRPNKYADQYDKKRAHIIVFNGSNAASVSVPLPAGTLTVGDTYSVKDVQNFSGPAIASGTYQGGAISIPMTSTAIEAPYSIPAHRQGSSMPRHTDQEFGAFVLFAGTGSVPPPPPVPAPTGSLSANPLSLPAGGGTTTLTWASQNATTATINGTAVVLNGTLNAALTQTTTYTLRLVGSGGSVSYPVSVVVAASPPPPPPPPSTVSAYDTVSVMGQMFLIRKANTDTTIYPAVRIRKGGQ